MPNYAIKLYLHSAFGTHISVRKIGKQLGSHLKVFCMRRKVAAARVRVLGRTKERKKAQAIRDQTMLSPSSYHDFRRLCCRRRRRRRVRFSLSFGNCT